MLWYSAKTFPCGFLIHGPSAHPDCSFVVRYDSVRPDEPMNPKVSQRRMYVRKNCGQRRKRAGDKVMEGVVPRADEKGRAVEERVERGWGVGEG